MKNRSTIKRPLVLTAVGAAIMLLLSGLTPGASAGADPAFAYYGYMDILPNPNPAISGENTHITVTVTNLGTDPATNVEARLSFNDWGVTFQGWQPIGTQTAASIPPGGTAVLEYDYVFQNRAHTCLEALIVSADANDDPNNDRGQINMEVINSGESFEYYVPIVNNGDAGVFLNVHGECAGGGPDGAIPGARCKPVQEDVFVPAGGEVLVPVGVDFLPGTPRGSVVDVIVNAVDLQNPGDARAMNHVVVRVIYNSAKGLKQDALDMLSALPPLPPPEGNRIETIARHIRKSLAPRLWLDDFRLAPRGAARVYAQEMTAAIQALKLVNRDSLPIEWKSQLDAVVRALTDADRILVQTIIKDAGGYPEAEAILQEADELRLAGDYVEAIRKLLHVTLMK